MSRLSCTMMNMDNYASTRDAVNKDPAIGQGKFSTVTEWHGGAQASTKARTFSIKTDEPQPLGGKDEHIDPMELLLAALGSCLTIGWVTHANKRGVDFRNLKITVDADFDLRGYLELDPKVRPGFGGLSYKVEVDTDASPAVLAEIQKAAEKGSPMFDNILNGTPIKGTIQRAA